MKSTLKVRKFIVLSAASLFVCVQLLSLRAYAAEVSDSKETGRQSRIVLVADVSGSMGEADSSFYIKDALKLCADLAPYDAQVALVTVSDKIVSETPLLRADDQAGRNDFKGTVNNITYNGNTNFGAGFERALEILDAADADNAGSHIIFFGDFSEGGYTKLKPAEYDRETERLSGFADAAKGRGISIDLVLLGDPPADSAAAPGVLALSGKTGGKTFRLLEAEDFPKAVHDIFFSSFEYLSTMFRVENISDGQTANIPMPTDHVSRARIYVSASKPVLDMNASYAGAALAGEFNRSYAMVRLDRPSREGISIKFNSGQFLAADIYLLLDYAPSLSVSVSNEIIYQEAEALTENEDLKEGGALPPVPVQISALTAVVNDTDSGLPLLSAPFPSGLLYNVSLLAPDGKETPLVPDTDTPYKYTFNPVLYGGYTVSVKMSVDGAEIAVLEDTVNVEDIRPAPEEPLPEPEPKDWSVPIAIVIAGLLVSAALIIALNHKRREAEFMGAAEMSSDYRFHGKLSVYALMIDGGSRELRPFDFMLNTLTEKRVSLRSVLDSAGANGFYAGAQDILFLVGPEGSLIMRNNSKAAIKVMGRTLEARSKAQLFYGQKAYIIFEPNENELEIVYRKAKEEEPDPVTFNFRKSTR